MKRKAGTAIHDGKRRIEHLAERAEKLSDRVDETIKGSNVLVALLALGLSANIAACTEAVTVEQSANESLYAQQFVRMTLEQQPEWAADILGFARFLANCLSTLATEVSYKPALATTPCEVS